MQIDVKPGEVENPVNLKSHAAIPVLIYGTPTLDASKIDIGTLRLAGAGVMQNRNGRFNAAEGDFTGDGFKDLMVHFDADSLGLTRDDTVVRLDGATRDSRVIWGEDAVRIVRSKE